MFLDLIVSQDLPWTDKVTVYLNIKIIYFFNPQNKFP